MINPLRSLPLKIGRVLPFSKVAVTRLQLMSASRAVRPTTSPLNGCRRNCSVFPDTTSSDPTCSHFANAGVVVMVRMATVRMMLALVMTRLSSGPQRTLAVRRIRVTNNVGYTGTERLLRFAAKAFSAFATPVSDRLIVNDVATRTGLGYYTKGHNLASGYQISPATRLSARPIRPARARCATHGRTYVVAIPRKTRQL